MSVIKKGGKILGDKLPLETPQVDRHTLQIRAKYAFAHNCSGFAAGDILREGLVRPSATELPNWIYTPGFYCRAAICQTHDESSFSQALNEALAKAKAVSRQTSHVAINQGGTTADHGCLQFLDALHSTRDKRWSFQSHLWAWQHSVTRLQTLWHESGHENDLADFFGSSVMMCKFAEDFSEQACFFSRSSNFLDSVSL